jgi:hypothetical protein
LPGLGFYRGRTYIPGMLRMRKKPPEGMPNVNSGQPWSDFDLDELEELIERGRSLEAIADYLCRDVDGVEIEAKVRGLSPK